MRKKRILSGIGFVLCAVAVVGMIVFYSLFTSTHIYNESTNHLQEIYTQVNTRFSEVVQRNWNVLNGWSDYIEEKVDEGDDDSLAEFIEQRRADWGFTNFYFLNDEGIGRLVKPVKGADGQDVYERDLSIPAEKIDRLKGLNNIVIDGVRIEAEEGGTDTNITLFAIPVDSSKYTVKTYKDFEYIALGMSFDSSAMTNTLNIDAFSGQGRVFVADSEGNLLMASSKQEEHFDNFLTHIDDENDKAFFSKGNYADLLSAFVEGTSYDCLFRIHGTEYYVTCQPVNFNNWMMIGLVPSSVLNDSLNTFRVVTIIVMAGIFVLLAVAVVIVILVINKRNVVKKEIQLKSRDSLFDMLTTNTNDIFVLFSPDTFVAEYVSPNTYRMLGIDSDIVRKDVRNILKSCKENVSAFTTEGLKELPRSHTWESDLQMNNIYTGEEYWFKLMLYRAEYAMTESFVLMLSDRTKERRMNEKLEQTLGIAKAANSAKSNFLSNMSHDIRTPMNAIIGFATLIAKDADKPEKVLEYVKKISYSSQHLLGLINDILDMSKIESGKTSLNMVEFSLSEFLEELYSIMAPQAKSKNQTFEVHTKGTIPEMVLGDKLRLNQILINLISNAVKYTPANGEIDIVVEAMEQAVHNHAHLRFIVQDNGYGMSKEFLETIFDPFSREVTSETKKIQGTGLGMAITKNIVDLMGGTISVQSELNKGSTFTVELELATVETEEDEEFWAHHSIAKALVVDDEEEICLDIKELMSGTGVEVSYALDGHKAVEMIYEACDKNEDYNIVLLDWKMPGLNGVETAKKIRERVGKEVPILILTSYDFADIEEEAKQAGIDYCLAKPFFVSNLRRAVMQLSGTQEKADDNKAEEECSIEGLNILAAEDNEINAEILIDLLEMEGAKCEVMPNGKEVAEKFTSSKPGTYDLILMDVQMPVMNGYEATQAIRASSHEEAKTIPILAMTANAFDDDVKKALDSGMNAHLAKPIDIVKVKATIAATRAGK